LLIRIKGINNSAIVTTTIWDEADGKRYQRVERGYAKCDIPGFGKSFWRSGEYKGFNCKLSACVFEKGKDYNANCIKPQFRKIFKGQGRPMMQKYEKLYQFDKANLSSLK